MHWKTVPPEHWKRAQELRHEATEAEQILWNAIRGGRLGVKFRRQHPFGMFLLDFYASEIRLVVELDGGIHELAEVKERDAVRVEYLRMRQRVIVRFTNREVLESLDQVTEKLRAIIGELKTSEPHP